MTKEQLSESLAIPSLAARDHFIRIEHSLQANSRSPRVPNQNVGDGNVHLSFWCRKVTPHSKP
jgi:hypothetical protein